MTLHFMPLRGAAFAVLVLAAVAPARAAVFDFAALAPTNAATPLSIAADGITAAFTSPSGGGAFTTEGSVFATLGAAVLVNNNFAPEELDIGFSTGLSWISFGFATEDFGAATPLTLQAWLQGQPVGAAVATGTPAASGFPEGVLSFGGGLFDAVSITDADAPGFAIGAVDAVVPEPATAALFGAALLGLAGARRRGEKEIAP
jgi:hypothetical protein